MASGLPVIALKTAPPRVTVAAGEIVEDGKSGYLLPEDAESWRAALGRLLADRSLRERMGAAGRAVCRDRFTWGRHLEGLLATGAAGGQRS
jgi:glycosyltransferase involved in cell wall biosynthesis